MSFNSYTSTPPSPRSRSAPMQISMASSPHYQTSTSRTSSRSSISSDTTSTTSLRRESLSSPVAWQFNSSLQHRKDSISMQRRPSAYVSDADLWGVDMDDVPVLHEPPAPPRSAEQWLAQPLLPQVMSLPKRRVSSPASRKTRFEKTSRK